MIDPQARAGRCWYCGQRTLKQGDPPEHVVPAAIGAELTTDRICRECNTRAGRTVDQPFLRDWFLAAAREDSGVPDRHGSPPGRPRQKATLADGRPVWADLARGTVEVFPHSTKPDAAGEITLSAGTQADFDALVVKVADRLRTKGTPLPPLPTPRREPVSKVEVQVSLNKFTWARAPAKMALGCASLLLDEAWLDTPSAKQLQGWLWDDKPRTIDGAGELLALPYVLSDGDDFQQLCPPPNHLVCFVKTPGGWRLSCVLFGRLLATLSFDPGQEALSDTGWLFDPLARKVRQTTFMDLVDAVVRRQNP
jgi:hypothetical protein